MSPRKLGPPYVKTGFVVAFVLVCLLLVPGTWGHANFVESEPRQGARLAEVPAEISVTLSQDIDPAGSALRVVDQSGIRVDNDDLVVESGPEPVLIVTLKPDVPEGAYHVEWKALSRIDHHTTQGSFGFAVGNFTPPETIDQSTNAPGAASVIGRSIFFIGLFLAAAGVLFALVVAREPLGGLLRDVDLLGWPLLVAGSAILLGEAVGRTGLAPSQWPESVVLQDLVLRLLIATGVGLSAIFMRAPTGARRGVLSFGLLALAYYSARSGHASSEGWGWTVVDALHLLATATWVGGLLLFAFILIARNLVNVGDDQLAILGPRFSRSALAAVIVMALSGVTLGVGILGWPELARPFAWFAGLYGAALLGKIVLAVVMIGLASINRYVFLHQLGSTKAAPVRRRFGRFVAGEGSVGIIVLLLAAILTSTSPPYGTADDAQRETTGESEKFHVTLRANPVPSPGGFSDLELRIVWLVDDSVLLNDTCGRPSGCILLEVVAPGAEEHDEDETDVHHGGEHRILEPRGDAWWLVPDVLFVGEGEYEFLVEIQTEYEFFDVVELHLQVGHGEGGGHDEHAGHDMGETPAPTNSTATLGTLDPPVAPPTMPAADGSVVGNLLVLAGLSMGLAAVLFAWSVDPGRRLYSYVLVGAAFAHVVGVAMLASASGDGWDARLIVRAGASIFTLLALLGPVRLGMTVGTLSFIVASWGAFSKETGVWSSVNFVATAIWVGGTVLVLGVLLGRLLPGSATTDARALFVRWRSWSWVLSLWMLATSIALATTPGGSSAFAGARVVLAAGVVVVTATTRFGFGFGVLESLGPSRLGRVAVPTIVFTIHTACAVAILVLGAAIGAGA